MKTRVIVKVGMSVNMIPNSAHRLQSVLGSRSLLRGTDPIFCPSDQAKKVQRSDVRGEREKMTRQGATHDPSMAAS